MNPSKVEREKQIEGRLHSRLHATASPQPVEGREAPWSSGQIPGAATQCLGREVILTSLTASPAADLSRLFSASGEQERARTGILGILEACVPGSELAAIPASRADSRCRGQTFTKLFCRLLNYLLLTRNSGSERAAHFTTRTRMVDLN